MATRSSTVPASRPAAYGFFYARAFISIMMVALLALFTLSGAALFVSPSGQMANTIGWRLMGLDKGQWEALHIAFGFLSVPLAVVHLVINRRVVSGYLRDRVRRTFVWRRELLAAVLVTVGLAVAAIQDLPPVAQLMAWEASFNDVWAARAPDVIVAPGASATQGGGGLGRYAAVDPEGGALHLVGKEAAARAAAAEEEAASEPER